MTDAVAYTVKAAAAASGVSPDQIYKALRTTDQDAFPPPLEGYRNGKASNAAQLILADDLRDWIKRFPKAS